MSRKEMRTKLASILSDAGYEPRSYSGRAMYGERCVGVSLERSQSEAELVATMAKATTAKVAGEFETNSELDADDNVNNAFEAIETALEDFADMMMETKSDSLGLGTIVYWPYAKWSEQVDFESEEDPVSDEEEV